MSEGQILRLTGSADQPLSPQHPALLLASTAWEEALRQAETYLAAYHKQFPLRRGMGKEEMRSRLSAALPAKAFGPAMSLAVNRERVAEDATTYRLPTHRPTYTQAQRAQVDRFTAAMAENPYSPPSPAELGIEPEVLNALIEGGELVKIDENLFYTPAAYKQMREGILQAIDTQGEINVAAMRDLFGTTRKYAIPFLEHLDDLKVTRRVGDVRVRW
jgi:selenocysteine-specific elongation factor